MHWSASWSRPGRRPRSGSSGQPPSRYKSAAKRRPRTSTPLYGSSNEVRAAVERIAEARNWSPTWLNDAVKMYISHRITDADWEFWIDEGDVTILYARPQLLLAMKLRAGRGIRDAEDIHGLLDACGIASRTEAEELFERYYPEEVSPSGRCANSGSASRKRTDPSPIHSSPKPIRIEGLRTTGRAVQQRGATVRRWMSSFPPRPVERSQRRFARLRQQKCPSSRLHTNPPDCAGRCAASLRSLSSVLDLT